MKTFLFKLLTMAEGRLEISSDSETEKVSKFFLNSLREVVFYNKIILIRFINNNKYSPCSIVFIQTKFSGRKNSRHWNNSLKSSLKVHHLSFYTIGNSFFISYEKVKRSKWKKSGRKGTAQYMCHLRLHCARPIKI